MYVSYKSVGYANHLSCASSDLLSQVWCAGLIWKGGSLDDCAAKAMKWQNVIIETGSLDKDSVGKLTTSTVPSSKKVARALADYLQKRLKQVGQKRAELLVDEYGTDVFDMLNSTSAVEKLASLPQTTKAAATIIKNSWDTNPYRCTPPSLPPSCFSLLHFIAQCLDLAGCMNVLYCREGNIQTFLFELMA